MADCAACAALASDLESFESRIQEAALVPVPEALAERVLLRHQMDRQGVQLRMWALAASVVLVVGLGAVLWESTAPENEVVTAAALGEGHPAVAAISYVLDNEPRLLAENRTGDPAVLDKALARLGMVMPREGVAVRYLGECPVPGGRGEHVVLKTPFGHVSLILIPDLPITKRVVVAYRDRAALASPRQAGGYVLISDSVGALTRLEQLLL
jgi:hypothetical protein